MLKKINHVGLATPILLLLHLDPLQGVDSSVPPAVLMIMATLAGCRLWYYLLICTSHSLVLRLNSQEAKPQSFGQVISCRRRTTSSAH